MQLSLHTDYALRLLMLLAAEPDRLHTIEEVARRYRISRTHLMKIAMVLVERGWVHSVRGRGGGLRLARPAAQISIGAVVRHTEERLLPLDCLGPTPSGCVVANGCRLKRVFGEAINAFMAVLDACTLEQVAGAPEVAHRLIHLLSVAASADEQPAR